MWLCLPIAILWLSSGIEGHLMSKSDNHIETRATADTTAPSFAVSAGFSVQYASLDLLMNLRYTLDDYSAQVHLYHEDNLLKISDRKESLLRVQYIEDEATTVEKIGGELSENPWKGYFQVRLPSDKEVVITLSSIETHEVEGH